MKASNSLLALCALSGSMPLAAQHIDWAVRATAAFEADGPRDLGLADGRDENAFFLNIAPRALIELSPEWVGYVRGRIFLPTERIAPFDSGEPDDTRPSRAYAGVNELWIQYGGFTSYPGEALRLGRQHIRQTDNSWWDQDADALRWLLDTTLLKAEVGIAHAFSAFRTDGADVPSSQRDRTYYFGQVATDWRAENTVGLRAVHSRGGTDANGATLHDSQLTWLGAYAENGFYERLDAGYALSYAVSATYLTGKQQSLAMTQPQDVGAWQGNADLRWRPLQSVPLQIGGGYTWSQGGEDNGHSRQFQQTGMQSNRSYFTGTSTLIDRYNETLQPQLGNLHIVTAFISLDLDQDDASLIFTKFRRDDGLAPFTTNALTATPATTSRDIGVGVDLVLTHHFTHEQRRRRLLDRGDAFTASRRGSLISLRASMFVPGDAYGETARTDYRVLLEGTLWID